LKPDTYARAEISSGFVGSLERYVYQPPPRAVEAALGNPTAPAAAPSETVPTAAPGATPPTAAQSPTAPEGAAVPPTAATGPADGAMGQALTAGAANANSH